MNFQRLPSFPCKTPKPLAGRLLVPVKNCKSQAFFSASFATAVFDGKTLAPRPVVM
jgi:hypothetical protein